MLSIDVRRIIGEVAARHGVILDDDDPLVVAMTANAAVLEQLAQNLVAEVRRAAAELQKAALEVPAEASTALTAAAERAAAAVRDNVNADIQSASLKARAIVDAANRARTRTIAYQWLAIGTTAALALFAVGVLVGNRGW